ncbi:MAG: patatin, partial [Burkholderiaceae bacterium]
EQLLSQLESKPGQKYDAERAERDAQLLAASGDYERVDFHVEDRMGRDTLVFGMEDKSWGPNYFRLGLDLSTNLNGESAFDLRVSHNRHWLTDSGTEWRNQLTIGQTPRLYTEIYQPLGFQLGRSNDWFVAGWSAVERRNITLYDRDDGRGLARLNRSSFAFGGDLGQPWGRWGELRLGFSHEVWRIRPDLVTADAESAALLRQTWRETALRLRTIVDQLDYANFPQSGYRLVAELLAGQQSGPGEKRAFARRAELDFSAVRSWGGHTINFNIRAFDAQQPQDSAQGPYALGGFQQLSGYQQGQLTGSTLLFTRAVYYRRLNDAPLLARGLFLGGSLEAGNAWDDRRQLSGRDLRFASSLFVGADTGVGPLYLAVGYAPRGGAALYLFIGRP